MKHLIAELRSELQAEREKSRQLEEQLSVLRADYEFAVSFPPRADDVWLDGDGRRWVFQRFDLAVGIYGALRFQLEGSTSPNDVLVATHNAFAHHGGPLRLVEREGFKVVLPPRASE